MGGGPMNQMGGNQMSGNMGGQMSQMNNQMGGPPMGGQQMMGGGGMGQQMGSGQMGNQMMGSSGQMSGGQMMENKQVCWSMETSICCNSASSSTVHVVTFLAYSTLKSAWVWSWSDKR